MLSVGIDHLSERPVGQLSGGEWQRAILARALAQEPRVLLLDEPVASLDLGYQRQIYELVSRLSREKGIGVLAADHHLDLQAHFCDEVVLLEEGRILAQGSVTEVLTRERLEMAFRTPLRVGVDPADGRPAITWSFGDQPDTSTRSSAMRSAPQGPPRVPRERGTSPGEM